MALIPKWARAKVRTAKMRRKRAFIAKTRTSADMGAAEIVAYRNHARINKQEANASETITRWHGYPTEFVAFLSCFDKVPDDLLPPLVAITRQRKKEWQSAIRGQGMNYSICLTVCESKVRHIFCFVSGKTAFFVWLSHLRGMAYKSAGYTADYARLVIKGHQEDGHFDIENHLRWIETVQIPPRSTT